MDNVAVFQVLPEDKILLTKEEDQYWNSFSLYVQSGSVPPLKVLLRVSLGPQCVAQRYQDPCLSGPTFLARPFWPWPERHHHNKTIAFKIGHKRRFFGHKDVLPIRIC